MKRTTSVAVSAVLFVASCAEVSPSGCPVTAISSPQFEPGPDHPSTPDDPALVWFGTAALWTVLPAAGEYVPRKSVWWSEDFAGGEAEPMPELSVLYERLNSHAAPVAFPAPGTNAFTVEDGAFMINGIDPVTPGCWRVTAEYRDATLSYTYEVG